MHIHELLGELPRSRNADMPTEQVDRDGTLAGAYLPPLPAVRDLFHLPGGSSRLLRSGDTLRLPSNRIGSVWAVSTFFVDCLDDIKDVCYAFHIPPAAGCRVWAFVDDAQPDRWMAVCLIGILHGPHVEQTGVKVNHFLHVFGGLAPSVLVAAESVQLIPWYEYRQWRKHCDWILAASLWAWSGGEDIDSMETALYGKVNKLAAGL